MDFFAAACALQPVGSLRSSKRQYFTVLASLAFAKLCFATKKNTQAMKIFVLQCSFAVVLEFWHDLGENLRYI